MCNEPPVILFNVNNTNLTPEGYFILESVIGYTANTLIFFMMVPQIYKAYKSKLTDDISYKFIWISLVSNVLEITYGILINQIPVLLTGIICMIQMILLFVAKKLYDNPVELKIQRRTSMLEFKNLENAKKENEGNLEDINQDNSIIINQDINQDISEETTRIWEVTDDFFKYTFKGPVNFEVCNNELLKSYINCIKIEYIDL